MKAVQSLMRKAACFFWCRIGYKANKAQSIVVHPLTKGLPKVDLVSVSAVDSPERLAIARRLIKAYIFAKAAEKKNKLQPPQNDLWTNLINKEFAQLLQILSSEDAPALSKYMLHFGEQYTWFGGLTLSVDGFNQQKVPSIVALSYLDKLICLAEAEGVLDLENPEQSTLWGQNLYEDVNGIIDKIEKAIGISVVPLGGAVPVSGINTNRDPLHYRHINSLYAALRIKALLPANGAICEYGGGLGIVAYYASKLNFKNYTIFDLPLVNVFAGHFLMNTLDADAVRLFGENSSPKTTIHVLPYWECMTSPSKCYALALNQDSFPEIAPNLVLEYIRQIERTTTKYFLSINQEAKAPMGSRKQNSVSSLMSSFENFHRLYRMKYWVREGYLEELYELRSDKGLTKNEM